VSIIFLAGLILPLSVKPAYAYLDPGTGAMVLQLLLGGIAGILLVGKLYFVKIKSIISKLLGRQTRDQAAHEIENRNKKSGDN